MQVVIVECCMELCVTYRKQAFQSIINPDWNFDKMGIGGLDNQFSAIFRRAFASRVFPPEVVEQLGTDVLFYLICTSMKVLTCSVIDSFIAVLWVRHENSIVN